MTDLVERQAVLEAIKDYASMLWEKYYEPFPESTILEMVQDLPSVTPTERTGHCKDCKYFEYDSVAKVDGIPLIVAHEICSRWGDGCKTSEDGYCFLFEPQESERINCKSTKCENCINHNYCDYESQESEE